MLDISIELLQCIYATCLANYRVQTLVGICITCQLTRFLDPYSVLVIVVSRYIGMEFMSFVAAYLQFSAS